MPKTWESIKKMMKQGDYYFATVSGILTTHPGLIRWVDREVPEIGVITTKSYQIARNEGNPEPVIVEADYGCFGNAVGLRNPGMEKGHADLSGLIHHHPLRAVLNVSLSASSINDFITLTGAFEDVADTLELNFSCPHAAEGFGASIGSDPVLVSAYVAAIRRSTSAPLFVKLTPNVDNIGEIARAAVAAGADGISAINTVGPELYTEPHSGEPVLSNPRGRKGGKSGIWIHGIAETRIREIRQAVGPEVPIIGMGGVFSGEDAYRLRKAGADVIGLGSVFAQVPQSSIPAFVAQLKQDSETHTSLASMYASSRRQGEYLPCTIVEQETVGDLTLLRTDRTLPADPSQFVFLWIPGVGEKPFSIAGCEPLSFLIRKRGKVTRALFELEKGARVMVRGPYGYKISQPAESRVHIIAGGTGTAVMPELYRSLKAAGKEVHVWIAGRNSGELEMLRTRLGKGIPSRAIADQDGECLLLDELSAVLSETRPDEMKEAVFYNIGPLPFMERAAGIERRYGASPSSIFLSVESHTMCGIGLCGECTCGETMVCQEGTFTALSCIETHGIDLNRIYAEHGAPAILPAEK